MKPRKITPEYIKAFLLEHNPKLTLVEETFEGFIKKCKWIEEGFGEFWRTPKKVIHAKQWHHPNSSKKRRADTNLIKYGTKHVSQSPEIRKKIEQTSLDKYGAKCSAQGPEIKDKIKKTNLEKFGFERPTQSEEIKRKVRQTNLERFGFECSLQNPEVKKKAKQSLLERFGFECSLQSPQIQEKSKQTNLNKYGVEFSAQSPEVQEKVKRTNLKRYGFESPLQSLEVKEKIKQTNLERLGFESPLQSPQIQKKSKQTNLNKYGVEFSAQSQEVKEKIKQTNLNKYGFKCSLQDPEVKERALYTRIANGTLHKSHQEQELLEYCKTLDPETRSTVVYLKDKQFQIDILLPKFNVAIEYNGMFWHSEGNKLHYKNKHLDKTLACQEKGCRLIHIWETEWLSKPQVVKNYLRSVMGIFDKRVPARKCSIKEVPKEQAKTFLNQNHLQGSCPFNTALGLYHEGILVGIAALGTHHRSGELNVAKRFAFAQGVQVVGGISKLSKALLNLVEGGSIITWADRRLGAYGVYANSGWVLEEVLKPDYFYWSEVDRKVVSKQHYLQTKKKYGLNEREAAAKNRHLKIWDCGKYRFRMGKTSATQPNPSESDNI